MQSGRELRFPAEPLHDRRLGGQVRMQHLQRHLALEVQVAHPIHPTEAPRAESLEEFVVVAERAPQALFPVLRVLLGDELAGRDRRAFVGARVGREVLQHFGGGEVSVVGRRPQRAEQDAVERLRTGGAEEGGAFDFPGIEWRFLPGDGVVQDGPGGEDVAGRIAPCAVAHFGGHEFESRRKMPLPGYPRGCNCNSAGR